MVLEWNFLVVPDAFEQVWWHVYGNLFSSPYLGKSFGPFDQFQRAWLQAVLKFLAFATLFRFVLGDPSRLDSETTYLDRCASVILCILVEEQDQVSGEPHPARECNFSTQFHPYAGTHTNVKPAVHFWLGIKIGNTHNSSHIKIYIGVQLGLRALKLEIIFFLFLNFKHLKTTQGNDQNFRYSGCRTVFVQKVTFSSSLSLPVKHVFRWHWNGKKLCKYLYDSTIHSKLLRIILSEMY